MPPPKVCRVCLAGDLQFHRVLSPSLQIFYETLTHEKLNNGGPEVLCSYCIALLQKCSKFVETARRANTMLKKWCHGHTDQVLKPLQRYSKTAVEINTYIQTTSSDMEASNLQDVKIEPISTLCLDNGDDNIDPYLIEIQTDRKDHDIFNEIPSHFEQVEPQIDLKLELECTNDQTDLTNGETDLTNGETDLTNGETDHTNCETECIKETNDQILYLKEIQTDRKDHDIFNEIPTYFEQVKPQIDLKLELECTNDRTDLTNGETDLTYGETDLTNDETDLTNGETDHTNSETECMKETNDKILDPNTIYMDNVKEDFSMNKSKIKRNKLDNVKNNLISKTKDGKDKHSKEKKNKIEKEKFKTNKEKEFSCEMCDYKSCSMRYINQHKTRVHSGKKSISCPVCKEKLNNITYLNEHVKKKHNELNIKVKVLHCNMCDFICMKKSQLSNHLIIHSGRNVTCDFCNYVGSKLDVKNHLRSHIGEKRFSCYLCDFKSDTKLGIVQHKIDKHGSSDKLFYCLLCDFKFIANYQLKNHLWTHREEKTCTECRKEFQDVFELNDHFKLHEEIISCNDCDYTCSNRIKLLNHLKNHSKKFACDLCERTFSKMKHLKSHLKSHTGEKSLFCKLCDYKTDSINSLKRHSLIHTDRKPYSCTECESKHKSENRLKQHMKTVHSKIDTFDNRSCKKCNFKCSKIVQLRRHNKLYHPLVFRKKPGEKITCDYCGFTAIKKSQLERHIFKHTGYKPYICPECSLPFKCKYYLKKHRKIKHVYDRKTCPKCQKTLQNEAKLQMHMNVCLKKFLCDICGSKWKNSLLLKRHIMIHTGERPFACELCPYKCSLQSSMVKHKRIHTNEKPYACDKCSYRCAVNSNLLRHLVSHSNEKPFACHICDSKYKIKRDLKRHVDRLHGCSDII